MDWIDLAELAELESVALDALESFDDADTPSGTVSLDSARRRRAVSDAFGVIVSS